jgi:hypothetical protein
MIDCIVRRPDLKEKLSTFLSFLDRREHNPEGFQTLSKQHAETKPTETPTRRSKEKATQATSKPQ